MSKTWRLSPSWAVVKGIMNKMRVGKQRPGYTRKVVIFKQVRVPLWAQVLMETVERIDILTNHFICSSTAWLWEIPLGRPRRDDTDNHLINSLGAYLQRTFKRIVFIEQWEIYVERRE